MDKLSKLKVASAAFLFLLLSIDFEVGTSKIPINIIDAAKRLYSLPTASDSWFLPPNLDFRASGSGNEEAGGKVKDAVVKSLDKSRATVQDSAKSAANNLKHKLSRQDSKSLHEIM